MFAQVQDLLRKSCRNQLISKQTKEKLRPQGTAVGCRYVSEARGPGRNKQVKLSCDVETCNSEMKAALLKMLQKMLGLLR